MEGDGWVMVTFGQDVRHEVVVVNDEENQTVFRRSYWRFEIYFRIQVLPFHTFKGVFATRVKGIKNFIN